MKNKQPTNQQKPTGKWTHIKWSSITYHVDDNTAEQITKHKAEHEYIKTHTTKTYEISQYLPRGTVHITHHYIRSPQSRLNLPD